MIRLMLVAIISALAGYFICALMVLGSRQSRYEEHYLREDCPFCHPPEDRKLAERVRTMDRGIDD